MSSIWPTIPVLQAAVDRLPATRPIAGPLWTYVVPALLLLVAAVGTWLLYRRFASEEDSNGA